MSLRKLVTDNKVIIISAGISLCTIFCCWRMYALYTETFVDAFPRGQYDREKWGVVGDFFGGILNPIFTFSSMLLLMITLYQNHKELELSRTELSLTRDELVRSADAQNEQSITMNQQRFESTFFSLMRLFQSTISELSQGHLSQEEGRAPFYEKSIIDLEESRVIKNNKALTHDPDFHLISKARLRLFESNEKLHMSFRFLYQLLNHIDDLDGDIVKKKKYSNLIRAILPNNYFLLLAINCAVLSSDPFYKFKYLIEKYNFLEHLRFPVKRKPWNELFAEISRNYNDNAFGDGVNRNSFLERLDALLSEEKKGYAAVFVAEGRDLEINKD